MLSLVAVPIYSKRENTIATPKVEPVRLPAGRDAGIPAERLHTTKKNSIR